MGGVMKQPGLLGLPGFSTESSSSSEPLWHRQPGTVGHPMCASWSNGILLLKKFELILNLYQINIHFSKGLQFSREFFTALDWNKSKSSLTLILLGSIYKPNCNKIMFRFQNDKMTFFWLLSPLLSWHTDVKVTNHLVCPDFPHFSWKSG